MKNSIILFVIAASLLFACKKNDSSGPPSITSVRALDTTVRDSTFMMAVPGTIIVIQGQNLNGVQAIFFNDTLAYFNPAYATATNVIVTIPASSPTKATNPSVQDVIRLITDHGTVNYSFQLYLPPPYISSITLDSTATVVTINGGNFQGVEKISFPVSSGPDTAQSYEVNKTFNQIVATVPAGTPLVDSMRVYCTFGSVAFSYPPPMTISSVSNENGKEGTVLTINGANFIGVSDVIFPGGISGTDLQLQGVNRLRVTVPAGITAPDSLKVSGILGTATAPQLFDSYLQAASPGYLSTFEDQNATDNTGFVGWTGGYADATTAQTNYPGATGASSFILQSSPLPPNTSVGSQGNAGFVQLNNVPWVSGTSESVTGYSLKFEVYVANPWSAGAIWILMGDWYAWSDHYMARYAPWSAESGGVFQPSGWVTATIPLDQFVSTTGSAWSATPFPTGNAPGTFADFGTTALCFALVNDQPTPDVGANSLNIAIDNIRIVRGK